MFDVTPLAKLVLKKSAKRMFDTARRCEDSQRALLADLLKTASLTELGRKYGFADCTSYSDFATRVPIVDYEDIRPDVMRMVNGETDILWPGKVNRYAQSSGTSGGKSKYIPLTARSLRYCHYTGGANVMAAYFNLFPDTHLFGGKNFILGGSFANALSLPPGVKVGDLSASLIDCINPIANLYRVPNKEVALLVDWREKLPRLVEATAHADVRSLSGVPSWFMTVIEEVLKSRGATRLHDVWPNLEVFFHGGIAFAPYRAQYNRLIDPARMRYIDTYNASEGFFGVQADVSDESLLLLMDTDIFYELEILSGESRGKIIPVWEAVAGEVYALIITSSNGLWRYRLGDTIRIESTNPIKITIAGRTKSFINAFGEELMVYNADAALTKACEEIGAAIADYTAAPVYATDKSKGHHQWIISFRRQPADLEQFAHIFDKALMAENSDYEAKRSGDIFLAPPEIVVVPHSVFNTWLANTGKMGGQRKIPRLSNDRTLVDALLTIARTHNSLG